MKRFCLSNASAAYESPHLAGVNSFGTSTFMRQSSNLFSCLYFSSVSPFSLPIFVCFLSIQGHRLSAAKKHLAKCRLIKALNKQFQLLQNLFQCLLLSNATRWLDYFLIFGRFTLIKNSPIM